MIIESLTDEELEDVLNRVMNTLKDYKELRASNRYVLKQDLYLIDNHNLNMIGESLKYETDEGQEVIEIECYDCSVGYKMTVKRFEQEGNQCFICEEGRLMVKGVEVN